MKDNVSQSTKVKGCLAVTAWTLFLFILGVVLMVMGSCRSIQYVPVREEVRDTVRINKTDTVNHYEVKTEKEFVYVKDSASTMVDNEGKVLKNEIWHNKLVIREKSDSIAHYKALVDSLMAVKQRVKEVPVVYRKALTKTQQRLINMGYAFIGLLAAVILYLALIVYRKLKGK